jgi:predicted nucleic acid-binding protein
MPSVVVDMDVVSFAFKGDTRAALYDPHLMGKLLVLSFMTVAELDLWALERRWGRRRQQRMEDNLRRFAIYPYNRVLCQKWAEVTREADRKGRSIQTADAWIAATALVAGVPLVTHNAADFRGVAGLTIITEPGP